MPALEKLITQAKFKDEKQKALVGLLYVSNVITGYHEELFKKYGITCQQYNALRIMRAQLPKPCTVNLVRDRMIDKMSDTSRIVERLRKAGFVERIQSEKDRRAVDIIITPSGLRLLKRLDKEEKKMHKPTELISAKEARALNATIEKILDALV